MTEPPSQRAAPMGQDISQIAWLNPRHLTPCDLCTDPGKLDDLTKVFLRGREEELPPILVMPLDPDGWVLLVLDGNHRAGAAFAADRAVRGIILRSAEEMKAAGQGTPAEYVERLGLEEARSFFLIHARRSGRDRGGFAWYLESASRLRRTPR